MIGGNTRSETGVNRRDFPIATLIGCFAVICIFCVMAFSQAGDPLHLDNFDFPAVAKATAQTGLPIYYRGEDLPQHSGLYHPPLYIYTLASWLSIFGPGPTSARSLSIFCGLLSALLTLLVCRTLVGKNSTNKVASIFFVLYLLNPFALQGFAIADIDTSILPPLFIFTIWATLRLVLTDGDKRTSIVTTADYTLVVLALALCLWAKLTTPLLLPPIIFGILQIRHGYIRGGLIAAGISIASFLLFLVTFELFGYLTHLDISYTWHFVAESLASKSVASTSWASKISGYTTRFFSNFESYGRWDLFLVLASASIMTAIFISKACREGSDVSARWKAASVTSLGALSVVFFYSLITLPFGGAPFKYIMPAWPLLSLVTACAAHSLWRRGTQTRYLIAFAFVVGLLAGLLVFKDRSILTERGLVWVQYGTAILFAVIVAGASPVALSGREALGRLAGAVALFLMLTLTGTSIGRAVAQTRVTYAKQYDYGQTGFIQTRDWLMAHTSENEVIMSMKDIASAANRRYLENYGYLLGTPPIAAMEQRVEALGISVFVFTDGHGQDQLAANKEIAEWIASHTRKVAEFGDYRVYSKIK